MTITRTVTRECDNTLYVLRKNDCNYALMKNDEMYYATKKGAIETVTLTLTPFEKKWEILGKDIGAFWAAPFGATYKISGKHDNSLKEFSKKYKKGDACHVSQELYKEIEYSNKKDGHGWKRIYALYFEGQLFSSNHVTITLNGYIDNERTFYQELPADAITKE